jgi:hypothetical protein
MFWAHSLEDERTKEDISALLLHEFVSFVMAGLRPSTNENAPPLHIIAGRQVL